MPLENIELREVSQTHEDGYGVIPLTRGSQSRQTYRQKGGQQSPGALGSYCSVSTKFVFGAAKKNLKYIVVTVTQHQGIDATELYTHKMVKMVPKRAISLSHA